MTRPRRHHIKPRPTSTGVAACWNLTRESLPPAAMRARVLTILSDGHPSTPRDIAWPHGLLPTAVSAALLDLVREGRVARAGEPGRYLYSLAQPVAEETTLAPHFPADVSRVPA